MARILGIGNATLDIIHRVACYPAEDAEVRCLGRSADVGGNTANSLQVLGQLGHACTFAGVLSEDSEGRFVRAALNDRGVSTAACRMVAGGSMPVSTVILSADNGSRTILHWRDLPEYTAADFATLELAEFDWLHFEGRNPGQVRSMLQRAMADYPSIPRSLEVEKPRSGIDGLFGLASVLLFSAGFAQHHGYRHASDLLRAVQASHPAATLFCTRGASGAIARDREGRLYEQPASRPARVVDTLGAGDTFNAAVIDGCLGGLDTGATLQRACRLAGQKCGQIGLSGLTATDSPPA